MRHDRTTPGARPATEPPVHAVYVRPMFRADLLAVSRVERECFTDPAPPAGLARVRARPEVSSLVAELDGRVVGFLLYATRQHGVEVLGLAVAHGYRRRGVGRALVAKMLGRCRGNTPILVARADVHEANTGGQWFFRSMGFEATAVLRRACGDGTDCYRFEILP